VVLNHAWRRVAGTFQVDSADAKEASCGYSEGGY
jgi:hypothetical protein